MIALSQCANRSVQSTNNEVSKLVLSKEIIIFRFAKSYRMYGVLAGGGRCFSLTNSAMNRQGSMTNLCVT